MPDIEVVGVIDLNLQTPQEIYNKLLSFRRDYYAPNQRIVVQYTEQDYFYHESKVGFAIHNFLNILYYVDISLSQLTFVTTNNRLEESIKPFVPHEKDVPEIHVVLVSRMTYNNIQDIVKAPILPDKNIKHVGLCMLGTVREHRYRLLQYLKHHDLLGHIQTASNNKNNPMLSPIRDTTAARSVRGDLADLGLVYSFVGGNQSWSKPIINRELIELSNVPVETNLVNPNIPASGYDFYSNFAVDIVTETNFDYPSQFISEKTLRPLLLKTPFLIFGPFQFLAYLKSWGFETFNDLWDENYDLIEDSQDRFIKCCHVVKDIAQRPIEYWNSVYEKINDRLDHNRQVLLQYIENDFKSIHSKYKL